MELYAELLKLRNRINECADVHEEEINITKYKKGRGEFFLANEIMGMREAVQDAIEVYEEANGFHEDDDGGYADHLYETGREQRTWM